MGGYNFAAWTLSARAKSLVSLRALTRVSHVTGSSPFPLSHSPRMLREILFGFPRCSSSMMSTLSPVSSLRRKIPNVVWLVAIPSGISRRSSSGRVGRQTPSPAKKLREREQQLKVRVSQYIRGISTHYGSREDCF